MANACVFVQETQISSSFTEVRNKKDIETTLRVFENNLKDNRQTLKNFRLIIDGSILSDF